MIAYTNYFTDARVRREAETLAALPEYKVTFLALKEGISPKTYNVDGVQMIELNINKYRGKGNLKYLISYCKFMLLAFLTCNKLFFERQIDVVHVHNMPDFLIFSGILPRLFQKKVILDIHDSMPETYSTKFAGGSNRLLFKMLCLEEAVCCGLANKVICVNHVQRDVLIKRGLDSKKITVSMNVPDHKRFSMKKNGKGGEKSRKGFRLVYHGTLAKRLGVDLAIEAAAMLVDEIPGLEFNILGHGDDMQEFVDLSRNLGIDKYVHFSRRMVPLEDLTKILQEMDIGVVSNRKNIATELMLPVKMLEYVALGIPVIVPKLKTIQHYFSEDMVFYFESEDINSLSDAIFDAFSNETKRVYKAQNARMFLQRYGWENHSLDLISLYKSLS